jgi:hypothetical protein
LTPGGREAAMTDENWKPLFRASTSTVTKVLRSHAFLHSRELSADTAENPDKLRALADSVEMLDHRNPPLAVLADRVAAAVRFLRARAEDLEAKGSARRSGSTAAEPLPGRSASAGVAARERLLIASLHYLVTPVDLVPDFRPGGYIDDVLLLAWVFGVGTSELAPYLTEGLDDLEAASAET